MQDSCCNPVALTKMDSSTNVPILFSNTLKSIINFLSYLLKTYIFEETEVFPPFSKDIGVGFWHN